MPHYRDTGLYMKLATFLQGIVEQQNLGRYTSGDLYELEEANIRMHFVVKRIKARLNEEWAYRIKNKK